MPYFVVETSDTFGNKELLAAPEGWVQFAEGQALLSWPNVRNITTLNKLLEDEQSEPSMMWEKHECEVLRRNIVSLGQAGKAIEHIRTLAEAGKAGKATTSKAASSPTVTAATEKTPARKPKIPTPVSTRVGSRHTGGKPAAISGNVYHVADVEDSEDPLVPYKRELVANRPSSKMFSDLRELIDRKNRELDYKMTQGFSRLNRMIAAIKTKQKDPQNRTVSSTEEQHTAAAAQEFEVISIERITTLKEMVELEDRLNDPEYQKQVHLWIDCTVGYETNPEARMMIILDMLIDKHFLPNFSWTGASRTGAKKYPFAEYPNVCRVFQYAGTTKHHRADMVYVSQFFMKKLKYASARAESYKAIRRSAPHAPFTKRKKSLEDEHDYANDDIAPVGDLKNRKVEDAKDDEEEVEIIEEVEITPGGSAGYGQISISIEGIDFSSVEDYEEADYESIVGKKSSDTQPETLFMSAEDESE